MVRITPSVWGPPMWKTIHVIALGYPETPSETDKKTYKEFFKMLGRVIPCPTCAEGYREILDEKFPVEDALSSCHDLFRWSVNVHNEVSKKLGSPPMSEDFVKNRYLMDKPVPETSGPLASPVTEEMSNEPGRGFPVFALVSSFLAVGLILLLVIFLVRRKPAKR